MPEIKLEPFSANIIFRLKEHRKAVEDSLILADFLETIAIKCEKAGSYLIGHIKGLVFGKNKSFLKISVTSASLPAIIEGNSYQAENIITLKLNVIVYGLLSDTLEEIVRETATEFEEYHFDSVTVNHTVK